MGQKVKVQVRGAGYWAERREAVRRAVEAARVAVEAKVAVAVVA